MKTNLIMLQFEKDIRHHWLLLASWGLILAIQPILNIIPFSGLVSSQIVTAFSMMIVSVQALLIVVMIPLLVHEEPLVDSTAFWLTRPLSARTILPAKALFVVLLIVLPALAAEITGFMMSGFSFRQILPGIPEIIIEKLVFVIPLLIIASLTRNFSIYAITCVTIFISIYFILPLLGWILIVFGPHAFLYGSYHLGTTPTLGLTASRKVVADLVLILTGSFIVYCQYKTRNTRRSIVYSIVLITIFLLVKWFWPLDVLYYYQASSSVKKETPSTESISVTANGFHRQNLGAIGRGLHKMYLNAYLEVLNVPPGYAAKIKKAKSAKIVFPDLTVSGSSSTPPTNPADILAPSDIDVEVLHFVLNNAEVLNAEKKPQICTMISLRKDDFSKCAGKTGVYSADLVFSTFKYKIIAELPLEKGASCMDGSKRTTLMRVKQVDGGCEISVSSKKINLVFAANPDRGKTYLEKMTDLENFFNLGGNYVLHNSQDNSVCVPSSMTPNPFEFIARLYGLSGRTENSSCDLEFKMPFEEGRKAEEWLRNAKLVVLGTEETGEVTKPFKIENFSMSEFSDETKQNNIGKGKKK